MVADFGIAKALSEAAGDRLTDTGISVGTPAYMSPEQAAGMGEIDERSDVYSLACVLYEMLGGEAPHSGKSLREIMTKRLLGDLRSIRTLRPDVSPELETVLKKALAVVFTDRYSTAREFSEALGAGKQVRSALEPSRRRALVRALIITAVAVSGLFGGWLALHDPAPRKAVAVLPFDNLSPDPENEFFAAGIHEDILSQLAKIGDLTVISRTSVLQYADKDKPIPQIAEELGVYAILEGSVRRAGDQVRVVTQLIDAQADAQLWSETYDRELTVANVFEIQSGIAERITNALQAKLTPEERRRISSPPTSDLAAYDHYLRGLEFMGRSHEEPDIRIALEMFEKATRLDTNFAAAYARLSQAHSLIYSFYYDRSQERLAQAKQAVDRSLELEPDLPEAHLALGYYYYRADVDYERALQHFETALIQQPGNSDLLWGMGSLERFRGNLQVALAHFKRALELDPRDALTHDALADTHGRLLRNYSQAESHYDRTLTFAPDMIWSYGNKAWLYICWQGNTSKARAVLQEAADRRLDSVDDAYVGYGWVLLDFFDCEYEAALARLASGSSTAFSTIFYYIPKALLAAQIYDLANQPELARQRYDSAAALLEDMILKTPDDSRLYGALGIAYAGLGRVDEAIRAGERGVELLPLSKDAWRGLYRVEELALTLTMTGRYDAAIDRIELLLSVPGDMSVARLRLDPRWDPLRQHPRFRALLDKYE